MKKATREFEQNIVSKNQAEINLHLKCEDNPRNFTWMDDFLGIMKQTSQNKNPIDPMLDRSIRRTTSI